MTTTLGTKKAFGEWFLIIRMGGNESQFVTIPRRQWDILKEQGLPVEG